MSSIAMLRSTHAQTRNLMRVLFISACALAPLGNTPAQSPAKEAKETGTIAGRVTADAHGVAGVLVALLPVEFGSERKPAARATSDADGRYQLVNVPPGSYYLTTTAPAHTLTNADAAILWRGRQLNIVAGDRLAEIDFTLTRGGVITGRVTNADGRPLIETPVNIMAADEADRHKPQFAQTRPAPFAFSTDDRGVYRFYGLAAGRYLVSVGEAPDTEGPRSFNNSSYYPRTFYGDTTAQAEAKPVEVTGGAETSGVDITVGKPERTYEAAGRVVDETGHAVANAGVSAMPVNMGGGVTIERTNERGEFRVKNLRPGRYIASARDEQVFTSGQSISYSDAVRFEISAQDASGLELKLTRGATISGTVVLEGTNSPAVRARLGDLRLGANTLMPADSRVPQATSQAKVNADGSFLITGLRPGTIQFYLGYPPVKGFMLTRVESGGVAQPQQLELAAGAQLTGVRVVVAYAVGVIRGQVQFPSGAWPTDGRIAVNVQRVGATMPNRGHVASVVVDELGRFVVENLSAGEYELTLFDASPTRPTAGQGRQPADRKSVIVPDNGEVQITLVFKQEPPQ